jgi:hypothetical protein
MRKNQFNKGRNTMTKSITIKTASALAALCTFTGLASTAEAGFRDVKVTRVVFNNLPASGGDFPSPASQVAYVTVENQSDQWAGSGVTCNLSTGHDCLSHEFEVNIGGKVSRARTNTLPPRGSAMIAVPYPAGTLKDCQQADVSIVGTYAGDALWALNTTKLRIRANGSRVLCNFIPAPLPTIPVPPPFPR